MYPKHLVYPPGGGEIQLEQLRAALPQYCYHPPIEKADEMVCDMEMTTAYPTNITELVPVIPSAERGKKMLQERRPLKELDRGGRVDDVDEELEKLFEDPPSFPPHEQLDIDPIEQQMEQLMLEREKEIGYQMDKDASEKENQPVDAASKSAFHFTPSMSEDRPSDR